MAPPLSEAQTADFAHQGWLRVPGLLAPDAIGHVMDQLAPCREITGKLDDLWMASQAVRRVAAAPEVAAVLTQLYDARPTPFQTLNFVRGSEQALHADDIHFDSVPPGRMCGVWVAFEDVGSEQGPLLVVSGSHRIEQLRPDHVLSALRPFRYDEYERTVHDAVAGMATTTLTASAGDVIVWQAGLVHGGAPVAREGSSRWSQVTHYVFDGSPCITPMRSPGMPDTMALREGLVDITDGRRVPPTLDGRPARLLRVGRGMAKLLPAGAPAPPLRLRAASFARGVVVGTRRHVASARHRSRCRKLLEL